MDYGFPLCCPAWNYNSVEGREHLKVYRQALLAGLKEAPRRPTNLAKVRGVIQGLDKPPAAFLERLMKAFIQYTTHDVESKETESQ